MLPTFAYFKSLFHHLLNHSYKLDGVVDHGVSYALYVKDPDQNGLEFYVDQDPLLWPKKDGQIIMYTKALDEKIKHELTHNVKPYIRPNDAIIGHIHLSVCNLLESKRLFSDIIGFNDIYHGMHLALFLGDHNYHHHIGINTWGDCDIPFSNDDLGLLSYHIHIPKKDIPTLIKNLNENDFTFHETPYDIKIHDKLGQIIIIDKPS